MKKTTEKKNHGKKIIMHLKRHHRKYLFGAFGGFAIVKTILLFFGLGPVLNIGNIFAGSEDPIRLTQQYLTENCPIEGANISCTGKNIESIEPGTFSGMNIDTLDLSYNKLSNIDFEVFSGSTITTLDISHNQIYEVSNPETINDNNTTVDISYNCLPNSMINKINNKSGTTGQFACFYVEYQPTTWTNSSVQATLSVTGNDDIVSDILSDIKEELSYRIFNDSGFGGINFGDTFSSHSGNILNYPEDSQTFPAYVNWIDKTEPTCGDREYTPSIEGRSTGITATLYGSYDNDTGAGIDISGGICLLTGNETPCEVEISDLAGNTKKCSTAIPNKIDNTKPYVSFDVMNGTGKSITVILSGNDDSGLQDNSKVYYKIGDSSCSDDNWTGNFLENNQYLSVNIDSLDDGTYYLCVKEDSLFDKAGNGNVATQAGPFTLDNTAPNCTRGNPSSGSLQIGETGNVTLTCSDTNGILTDNLSSTGIEYSGYVITLSNAEIENNDGNISYTFVYTAVSSGNTSLILKTGAVQDNAGNGNTGGAFVEISVHDEQQAPTGPLVYFEKQPSGNWVSQQDITIVLTDGATGCYRHQTITGSRQSGNCQDINSGSVQLSIIHEHRNNGYICAFWQSGFYTGFVCSDHPILVDPSNPSIELLGPVNGTSVNLGDSITLSWSGSDNKSGLSGYELAIQRPNSGTGYSYYNSGVTSTGFTVDQTGTRFWSVTAYDNVGNEKYSDEWFFGVLNGDDSPEILGDLVSFDGEKKPHGNWVSQQDIKIVRTGGATGCIAYSDNTGTFDGCDDVYSGEHSFTIDYEDHNNEYICASWQSGFYTGFVCSDDPVLVDRSNPNIQLLGPANGTSVNLGDSITLSWSGSDNKSGLSGYELAIQKPNSGTGYSYYNSGVTSTGFTVDQTGTRFWSVTAYDNVGRQESSSGWSVVVLNGDDSPEILGDLVSFEKQPSGNWSQSEEIIIIHWQDGATGGYLIKDNNNTGILWNKDSYTGSNGDDVTLTFTDENNNGEYVCAFGQTGEHITTICTDHPILVDTIDPTCSTTWTYVPNSGNTNGWSNTEVTATLSDSTDEGGSGILTGGGSCIIESGENSTCTVTISDNAGNTTSCISSGFNIDTQAPTITLDNQSGAASNSHSIEVTITDDIAGFEENSLIRYKWQIDENSCDTDNYNSGALSNSGGAFEITTTISTSNLSDGTYYLCISGVQDQAGNRSEAARTDGVFVVDNTKPGCTRGNPSSGSLQKGQTGSITLTCSDNLAGIQTMNITSGNISFSSGGVLQINNISTGSIAGGVKYDIEFQAIGSGITTLTLKANSVKDNANNGNPAGITSDGISVNDNNGNNHNSPESLIEISGLVTIDGPSGNRVNEDTVEIHWNSGATGGYLIKNNKISDIQWNSTPHTSHNGGSVTLTFTGESNNSKYICAFGQTGGYITSICSNYPIRVDRSNPNIQLLSPANGTTFNFGDSITLSWSGSDGKSGISGYVLAIKRPNNNTGYYYYNSGTTSTRFTLNQTGTRFWSVTAYDNTAHYITRVGTFVVQQNGGGGDTPVPGVLVSFGRQPSGNWTDGETIIINWHNGATGGYRYQTSTGSRQAGSYTQVSSGSATLNIRDENHNKYICAYGQTGGYTGFICSTHPVKVDITNPSLSLVYPDPSVSYDFKKGTNIRFVWSGNDDRSGISGYVFDVVSPSGSHDPHNFGSNTTAYTKTLNETGRRYWYVTGYDNTNHRIYKSGSFYVSEDGGIPENGFYLISPALGAQINLGNNVVLSWNPGTVNSGYIWTVKKISGTTIATGTTTGLTATVNGGKFSTGAYSRSVKDIATDTTKSIPLFYIIDNSDAPDLEVNPFEFNEVENADLDEYYSSNRITIRGLSDDWYTLAYLGSGIGALYINGQFVGTSGYVQNGDKVYIEMKASDEYNKTVKTTLFVGVGSNTVSGDFKITTKDGIHDWDDSSLTPMQKLWGVIYVDSLVEMYQYDEKKLATFLSTFMQLLQDKSDYYASKIQEAEEDGDEELAKEYKLYKEAIDFLYITVKYRYDHLDVEDHTIYIAPNGKQYLIEYDEDRMAYTSPDFVRTKYFPTWELLTNHIDINNPAVGKWGIVGNVITTHNGKVYTIYEKNGKWTSSNFKTAKYFDTKEDIINHILANNPASDWDHKIDTDFDEVKHTAPNGRVYKIFKTSSKGNNPNMYSSYDFVNAKYFTSLEAAKKFINQNNPK